MEEGELFAIETFGSTGKGRVFNAPDCSHYMRNFEMEEKAIRNPKASALLKEITNTMQASAKDHQGFCSMRHALHNI